MNWGEDSWEDISEPSSPSTDKDLQFPSDPPHGGRLGNGGWNQPLHDSETSTEEPDEGPGYSAFSKTLGARDEWSSSDIAELKKLLQEAQEHRPARLKGQGRKAVAPPPNTALRTDLQTSGEAIASRTPHSETSPASSNLDNSSRTNRVSSATNGRHASQEKSIISDQHSKNVPCIKPSPKVPQVVKKSQTDTEKQQRTVLQKSSGNGQLISSQSSATRISTEVYPVSVPRNGAPPRNYSLHEYMKEKQSARYGLKGEYGKPRVPLIIFLFVCFLPQLLSLSISLFPPLSPPYHCYY